MANPMENGPSHCNGEAEQVWERPWTLEEMRKNSANWSLAADSGLFLYMQDFSQWMLSKTHEIEKQLDGLIRDTKATDSCLHTVFNDFLMLSNIQFIENRVYDEEVEEAVPKTDAQERRPEQERTREQKEAELIPKVQEAMNYGLKVLESAFEQLDVKVGNSDSEDEEAADRVEPILEPKDLYVDRPLPYLIGSQAFMEQDDVGLGDLSSDEMSIDSDRESFIESEADKDQEKQHSDEDSDQAEESQGSLKKKLVSSDEDEDDEDSDLFGESDKDEDEAKRDDVDPTSFAHQLAARIKDTTKKPEADRTSLSSGTSVTKRKKQGKKPPEAQVEDDEMFKPPEMEDDEYSPFGEKGGLFSGGKGLFDDDGEEYLFSEAPKMQKEQTDIKKTEIVSAKKIPTGAVSIFPGNNLFGSPNGSDSLESKENDRPVKSKMQAAREQTSLGSGLFDDNDDDDFFTGKAVKKSAVQEKPKPKVTADLFGGDDNEEDGDIFSVGSRSAVSQESKKFGEEEEVVQQPEKKLPAGAISMFGPGTNSLLAESLKKRHPSTSEDFVKSVESVPPAEVKPSAASKATKKAQSLFSDDEDSQIFPTVPKSHSKPEGKVQNKPSKTAVSLFADDEEEDLFSSVPKSQSVPGKTAVSQTRKSLSSGLFSDDEDQWLNSQPSSAKPGVKSGGMKASTSAPSRLPSAKAPQKESLFDVDDDDDLFAATKESRQKNSQRVSLLFEDEDDEDKGSLFGFKPSANKGTPEVKVPIAASQTPPLFGSEETQEVVAEEKKAVQPAPPPEGSNKIKKPAGAVSLFGGISVLGDEAKNKTKQSKNTLDDLDDLDWHTEAPPPMETKEKKSTKNTFSLFDDDDEEEEPDETPPLSIANKNTDKSTIKSQEPKASVKSTGVFQDEELLFSQTQQKDNDPEVDLFAASSKPSKPVPSLVKPAVSTLFGEEDDDDDLFSTSKQKAPPKVPDKPSKAKHEETDKGSSTVQSIKSEKPVSPVTSKETSSRIGKLQASLAINPASLMPGAGPRVPSALSINSDLAPSSSPRPAGLLPASAATAGLQVAAGGGIGFDTPAQVTTLQNANKVRIKGAMQRRPQSRAARHLAAQQSEEGRLDSPEENSSYQAGSSARATSASSAFNPIPARPSALTLPISTNNTTMPAQTVSDGVVRPKILPAAEEDLFSSVDIFSSASVPKHTPSPQTKTKAPETVFHGAFKKKEPALPIFSDNGDDLFATVKPKTVKKAKAMPFLDADDDDDIFGKEKKKDSKSLASSTIPDIFQDDKETSSKVFTKPKEQSLEASLFNDDVDIFADLTPTTKPKEKKPKKKVETKSIFDDDMDDIFSAGFTKPVGTSTAKKSKKPVQEPNSAEESGHNIFDDPLNVFGGK